MLTHLDWWRWLYSHQKHLNYCANPWANAYLILVCLHIQAALLSFTGCGKDHREAWRPLTYFTCHRGWWGESPTSLAANVTAWKVISAFRTVCARSKCMYVYTVPVCTLSMQKNAKVTYSKRAARGIKGCYRVRCKSYEREHWIQSRD